jgi:hypothetical protein
MLLPHWRPLLGLLLALFGSRSLNVLAQVQTQTYTVPVAPRFNAIANHLNTGSNSLNQVLPNMPVGTRLYKWNPARQSFTQPAQYTASSGWLVPEPLVGTLSPGEGAVLEVGGQFSITFRGQAQQPQVRTDVVAGYNFVSCQTTQRCSFDEVLGFAPLAGDTVYKFDRPVSLLSTDPSQLASSTHRYDGKNWDTVPFFDRGHSAFVYLVNPPRIVRQPVSQTVMEGTNVQFSVAAVGAQPLRYQWLFEGRPLAGATSGVLLFQKVAFSNAGIYQVVVSNSFGAVTSAVAQLRVFSLPRILEPPRDQVHVVGETAVFRVVADGTPPLSYQWFHDTVAIPVGTNATLVIPDLKPGDAGKYSVEVKNAFGSVLSPPAQLDVLVPPFIITQPRSQTVNINDSVTFFVEAGGTPPLSYQWLRNGIIIPGATSPSFTIRGVQPQDGGSYRVVVANAAGAVSSDPALLRVNVPFHGLADNFKDRELFREPTLLFRSSNRGATSELDEPLHAGKPGGKSVWMAWSSDKSGIVTFRTRGSHIDTLLAAYVGERIDALTEVASDDDSGGYFNSEISFNVVANTIYSIAFDGFNGAEGELLIEWSFESTDEKLPVIVDQPLDQAVTLGSDVTFRVGVNAANPTFQWFFNGQPISEGTGPVLTLRSVPPDLAGTYYVRITDGRRSVISRMVTLQFSSVGPTGDVLPIFARDKFRDVVIRSQPLRLAASTPFSSDLAAAAPGVVHGYIGTQLFSTVGAVKDDGEPNHCGIPGGASYWFSYAPPASGELYLNTDGSSYDTVLAVYSATGPTYADLVPEACDNNSGTNGRTSSLHFTATGGVNYYVVVDGVNAATGTVRLNYKLLVPLLISNAAMTNSFAFRVTATPSYPFTIQRSSNLQSWSSILTTSSVSGSYNYLDTNAVSRRFYRALQTP